MASITNPKKSQLNANALNTIKLYQKAYKAKIDQLKNTDKKVLRESVIDWLFSKDYAFTQRILTIENPLTVNILNTMYNEYQIDKRITFSFTKNDSNSIPIFSVFPTNNSNSDYDYKLVHFFDFSSKLGVEPKKLHDSFVKQLNLVTFPGQSYFENITLGNVVLRDKNAFSMIIDNIDKECFTSFPGLEYNPINKITYIKLCDRILANYFVNSNLGSSSCENNNSNCLNSSSNQNSNLNSVNNYQFLINSGQSPYNIAYSLAEISLFFFEQVVMVRYLIYLDTQVVNSFKLNSKDYNLLFDENNELLRFVTDNVNKKGEAILDSIDFKAVIETIIKSQEIHDIIKVKTKREYGYYKTYYTNMKNSINCRRNPVFDCSDSTRLKESVVKQLRRGVSVFYDSLIYIPFKRIWTFDSFIANKIFDEISKLYKEKLIQDLLEDMDNDNGGNQKKKKQGNKKGKDKDKQKDKKGKGKKKDDNDEGNDDCNNNNNTKKDKVEVKQESFKENNNINNTIINVSKNSNKQIIISNAKNNNNNSNAATATISTNNNNKNSFETKENSLIKTESNIIYNNITIANTDDFDKNKKFYDELFGSDDEKTFEENNYNANNSKCNKINNNNNIDINKNNNINYNNKSINFKQNINENLDKPNNKSNNEHNNDPNNEIEVYDNNEVFISSNYHKKVTFQEQMQTTNSFVIGAQPIILEEDQIVGNTDQTDTGNTGSIVEINDVSTISSVVNSQKLHKVKSGKSCASYFSNTLENEQVDFCQEESLSQTEKLKKQHSNIYNNNNNHNNDYISNLNINSKAHSNQNSNQKAKHSQQIKQRFFLYDTSKLNKKNMSLKSINVVNHSKCLVKKFNRFDQNEYPFLYWQRLHNDIIDFSLQVIENISIVRPIKIELIEKLKQDFFTNLKSINNIIVYGSFATDLSIEFSDVDLRIALDSKANLNEEIQKFIEYCQINEIFEYVKPITTASVPVVKLCIDLQKYRSTNKHFNDKLEKLNAINNKEILRELSLMKFDITFALSSTSEMTEITNSISYVQKFCVKYPDLVPIILILKHYLNKSQFKSAYNGGISSFCLFIVVLAFKIFQINIIKKEVTHNLGTFLFEMMDFYGNSFSFLKYKIDIILNGK